MNGTNWTEIRMCDDISTISNSTMNYGLQARKNIVKRIKENDRGATKLVWTHIRNARW